MLSKKPFKYFAFGDVFEYERGRRLVSSSQIDGDIAYVSSTAINNGVDNYVMPPDYMTIYNNKLTLSNSGSVGYMFYHDYDFVASDHVMVIWPKYVVLNKYIAMFLKPIFEAIKYKYNFGREINDERLTGEFLFLPVNLSGEPDWVYMESYIKDLEQKVEFKNIDTENTYNKLLFECKEWKEFLISKLFDLDKGADLVGGQEPGDIPLISASGLNNGVAAYVYSGKKLFKGNQLSVATNGSIGETFYQSEPFYATSDICVLTPKGKFNKYIACFFVTVIFVEKYKYSYGRKFNLSRIRSTYVKLPVDENGSPDWEYMENYIKSLPYADLI